MTLEDFFTLTEMKNGFASLARVEELISVMQNQKACIINNVADVARQWSTCAGTIAATEKMDCLSHFVELNGLCFLNQWLQESLKCSNDDDGTVDDLVKGILRSLERLPFEREKPSVLEISRTVEQLLTHKNHSIKEKARTLLEMWSNTMVGDLEFQNLENLRSCQDEQKPPFDKKASEEGSCGVQSSESGVCNSKVSRPSDGSHMCAVVEGKTLVPNQIMSTSGSTEGASDTKKSFVPGAAQSTCQEILKESSLSPGKTSSSIFAASTGNVESDDTLEDLALEDGAKDINVQLKTEDSSTSKASLDITLSPSGKAVMESILPCNTDSKEVLSCAAKNEELQLMSVGASCRLPKTLRNTRELNSILNVSRDVEDRSGRFRLTKRDGSRGAFQRQEAAEVDGESKDLQSEVCMRTSRKMDLVIPSVSSKLVDKVSSVMDQKAEMELECGEIDALEVARQVAIEVEREVVDYREPFCSSSPEFSAGVVDSHSPVVVDSKEETELTEKYGNEMVAGNDSSDSDSDHENDGSMRSEKVDTSAEKSEQEMDSTEMTTSMKELNSKIDTNKFDFDLNEDVSTEDNLNPVFINQVNLSTPVAVSAFKGVPELPVSMLQSESAMGWKGSAATSAFRPASPRRTPDAGKTYSGSRQERGILEIDLNLSGSETNLPADPTCMKQIHQCDFFSGSSSAEVSSRRADNLRLDLNRLGNEDASYPSSLHWKLHHENGDQSLFYTPSSFSRHPSERDFDLNDKPSSVDMGGSYNLREPFSKSLSIFSCPKLEDPASSIGSSRIAVETKDSACQTPHPYSLNGLTMESPVPARPFHPYAYMHPHAYGLNGQPTWAYPPAVFGSGAVPYMVDSRGATVVPQILGTTASVPPFLMSMDSTPPFSSGIGSSQSSLNMNSSSTVERGSREPGGLFQFLAPAQASRADVHTMDASQPSSSGGTLKRKESDCGWEPCTLGYKQVTSWQ